jgi:hypothetical protein
MDSGNYRRTTRPVLFWLFCSGCPILAVLFWLSCSDCPALVAPFWLSRSDCLHWLSVSTKLSGFASPFCSPEADCTAHDDCSIPVVLFWLFRPVSPFPDWLSCPGCPVLTVLSWLSCPDSPVLDVLSWLSCSGTSVLELLLLLPSFFCAC